MKITKNGYGVEIKPEPPITGVGGSAGTFNLKEETVEQMLTAVPEYFRNKMLTQIHVLQQDVAALKSESYKQQDVDDIDCKLAALSKTVDILNTELQQMPGGYRNAQDIKRLQKRVDDLVAEGGPVTENALEKLHRSISLANGVASTAQRISDKNYSDIENLRQHHMELSSRLGKFENCGNTQWMQEVDKKIHGLEEIARVMSKAVDAMKEDCHDHIKDLRHVVNELNRLRTKQIQEDRVRLTKLEDSNEQRKRFVKHAFNMCIDPRQEMAIVETNRRSVGEAMNSLRAELASGACGNARQSVCFKKLDQMEECCKNTVAAGKEIEKRVDFVESSLKNHDSRLNQHRENLDGLTKAAARSQKFMDKIHDL